MNKRYDRTKETLLSQGPSFVSYVRQKRLEFGFFVVVVHKCCEREVRRIDKVEPVLRRHIESCWSGLRLLLLVLLLKECSGSGPVLPPQV